MGGIECNSNRAGSFEVCHRCRPDSHRAAVTPYVAARPDKPAVAHDTLNSTFTWSLILGPVALLACQQWTRKSIPSLKIYDENGWD